MATSSKTTANFIPKVPVKAPAKATAKHIPIESRDPRVDAYIAKSEPFSRPILSQLREIVHAACPEVEETIKWSMPFFDHHGPLCNMAAFKAHCSFGFWRSKEIEGLPKALGEDGMGNLGRLASLDDLPPRRELTRFIRAATKLNESDAKPARVKAAPRPVLDVPEDLAAALAHHEHAARHFEAFSPSARRDYIEWIVEAKQAGTRATRLATAIEWVAEGKTRHWKYKT